MLRKEERTFKATRTEFNAQSTIKLDIYKKTRN